MGTAEIDTGADLARPGLRDTLSRSRRREKQKRPHRKTLRRRYNFLLYEIKLPAEGRNLPMLKQGFFSLLPPSSFSPISYIEELLFSYNFVVCLSCHAGLYDNRNTKRE